MLINAINAIKRPLTDIDIRYFGQYLPHFRGVFMRNDLPKKCNKQECGVINLDDRNGAGTHWVSYYKQDDELCFYFDSFGDLQPFREFVHYVGNKCEIHFNYTKYQTYDSIVCGHLCLKFLFTLAFK